VATVHFRQFEPRAGERQQRICGREITKTVSLAKGRRLIKPRYPEWMRNTTANSAGVVKPKPLLRLTKPGLAGRDGPPEITFDVYREPGASPRDQYCRRHPPYCDPVDACRSRR